MLKKISCGIICANVLVAGSFAWASEHSLVKGISFDYNFPPKNPQYFENPSPLWTVNATCDLISPDESNEVVAAILKKKGKINDRPLSQGDSVVLMIRSGDKLKITAEPGAKASITNQGEHTFQARCTSTY